MPGNKWFHNSRFSRRPWIFSFFFSPWRAGQNLISCGTIDRSIHPSTEIGTVVETEIHLPQEKFKQNLTESSLTRSSNSFPRVNLQHLPLNLINTGLIGRPLLILCFVIRIFIRAFLDFIVLFFRKLNWFIYICIFNEGDDYFICIGEGDDDLIVELFIHLYFFLNARRFNYNYKYKIARV